MTSFARNQLPPQFSARQRVIVFKDYPVSGATLGYYGTVVRVYTASIRQNPRHPDRWIYSVYVRNLNGCVDVAAANLFATGDLDSSDLPVIPESTGPVCELRFHGTVGEENATIGGAYRPPGREWRLFSFHKCDTNFSRYEIIHSVPPHSHHVHSLNYYVPQSVRLDRSYVLRALAELFGVEWSD